MTKPRWYTQAEARAEINRIADSQPYPEADDFAAFKRRCAVIDVWTVPDKYDFSVSVIRSRHSEALKRALTSITDGKERAALINQSAQMVEDEISAMVMQEREPDARDKAFDEAFLERMFETGR